MIRSFGNRETENIWLGHRSRRLPEDIQRIGLRKLELIEAAATVDDLRIPPGNRLEMLKGDLKGFWSIRINQQWRIMFRFVNGNAENVEIIDYH
jgi:proteic killer suppression protein